MDVLGRHDGGFLLCSRAGKCQGRWARQRLVTLPGKPVTFGIRSIAVPEHTQDWCTTAES